MRIDVRTGGRLPPVEMIMKNKGSERDRMAGEREDAHEIDTRNCCIGSCDLRAGERMPKQRPLGDEHPEHNSEEHLGAQVPQQVEEAGSIVFHSSRNASVFEKGPCLQQRKRMKNSLIKMLKS